MRTSRNVTNIKQPANPRSQGLRILRASLLVGAAGITPLLLYILLGPANGNPIGLGLLAVVAAAVSIVGLAIGTITMLLERFARPRA